MIRARCGLERFHYLARRALGRNVDLQSGDVKVEVMCPGEWRRSPPAVALPGQLDKVLGVVFSTLEKEYAAFLGGMREITPLLRYEVRNAAIHKSMLYHGGHRKAFNVGTKNYNRNSDTARFRKAVLRSSFIGCHFFGHWLTDDCATTLIDESDDGDELFMPSPAWRDKGDYKKLFGLAQREVRSAVADTIVFFDDIGHTADKVRRLRALRGRMATAISDARTDKIVYVKRGVSATQRVLVNEAEIIEELDRRGVTIVEAEQTDVPSMLRQMMGSPLLISVEGSQIAHGIYSLRDGAGILTIQPPDRFFNTHMDWAAPLGMRYGGILGDLAPGGFTVDINDLLRTIDLYQL